MSDGLIAFWRERLDEDEAMARGVRDNSEPWPGQWEAEGDNAVRTYNGWVLVRGNGLAPGLTAHIACHDPARALRDVEADRAILDRLDRAIRYRDQVFAQEPPRSVSDEMRAVTTMMTLEAVAKIRAAVYSGHPDYRQEWKP